MESSLSLLYRDRQPLLEDFEGGIVRELEVVDAGHNTGEVIVRSERWLARFTDHGEKRCQTLEAC